MVTLSEDMTNEDLDSMKFLLGSTLPRERIEKVKVKKWMSCFHSSVCEWSFWCYGFIFLFWQTFLDVTIELEKQDLISPERVDFLEECLRNINRVDLAKEVVKYKMSGEALLLWLWSKSMWACDRKMF